MKGAAARGSLLIIFLLLAPAGARAAGKRIGIAKFEGAQEALVRKKVMASLKSHGFELVRSREIQDAVSSTGASLDTDDGLVAVAKELALSAILTGEVGPKRAKIVVHDGGEGSILGDASFSAANPRKLANEVGLTFWKKLGPDVGRGHVPAGAKKGQKAAAAAPEDDESASEGGEAAAGGEAAPPKPREKEDTPAAEAGGEEAPPPKKKKKPKMKMESEAAPAESAPSAPSGLPWLDLELGIGGLNRSLTFSQDLSVSPLFPYSLGLGAIATGNLVIYPLDPIIGGPLGNLGLESDFQQGFAISSTLNNMGMTTTYTNLVHDFAGGLRYRLPFAGTDEVYASATAGEDAFTFTGPNRSSLLIPDTIYRYFRPGLGLRVALPGAFTMMLSGGYRVVFNGAGPQMQHYFPRLTVAGADAEALVGYRLSDLFEARAGLEWRRYWYNMHSVPGDTYVAGGATDQSFAFTVRIALLIGGSGAPKTEGGAEEAPPPPPPPPKKSRGRHKTDDEESGGDSEGASPSVDTDSGKKSGGDDE